MTYARLCEHGELKAHVYRSGTGVSWWTIPVVTCPGGSVLPDDTLVIVKEDITYTIRCAACEIAGCHTGINGGHDGPDNPAVHTRDVWVLTDLAEKDVE